ncbi:MAG TPA: discoidin domain-containing protein [Anaerolineae bacterium]|nr:discoidin domain-containing protein [Anaerolineae bacterium]HQI84957.1 discoidin domain-containing protein [Anaerolineae bacterium]
MARDRHRLWRWSLVGLMMILGLWLVGGIRVPTVAQTGQYPGFRVEGRHLYDRFGNKVILYGVNKMVIYTDRDGIPAFPEIAKTGANVVRIVWLAEGSPEELDLAITNAINHQLIPLVDCHDSTGKWDALQVCVDYWVRPDVLAVLKKHEAYLLINIANEAGKDIIPDDKYRAGYTLAIWRMRAAGLHVPLIIDSSGYGQDINGLQKNGPYLIQVDPDHNLMFSIHMWWPSAWRGAQVAQFVIDEIKESVELNLPLIVGEFANKGPGCSCCIPYQTIIEQCALNEIGYLPWSWGPGNNDCAEMDMTEDGTFDTLHAWGLEVAITSTYSIRNLAVRPDWIVAAAPIPTATPAPTPTPLPVPEGIISIGRPVEVSSVENADLPGEKAVDGRLNSRWASEYADPQFITLDLGEVRDIARIVLVWEAAYGREYKLQVSDDGATWTDLVHETAGDGGQDDHRVTARGRYVRMEGLQRGTQWGYSLWEFWVFDRADAPLPEPDETGAVAESVDARPDLVVSKVAWLEDPLLKDKGVTFRAVVKNQGNTAVMPGFRCAFWVDGELVSWAEAAYPLAPGMEMTLIANNGPDGNALWEPDDTGPFVVLAWVDDALDEGTSRVDEVSENNNMQTGFGYMLLTPLPPTSTPISQPSATPTLAPTATPQPVEEKATLPAAEPAAPETPFPARNIALVGGAAALVIAAAVVGIVLRRRR